MATDPAMCVTLAGDVQPGRRQGLSVWLLLLSLTLHLAVLVGLLMRPSAAPPAGVSEPMPMEFITETGPAAAVLDAPAPTEPPAPELAVPPAEIPLPVPAAAPDVVSTVQPAEIPLPALAPAPTPMPPVPPQPVAPAHAPPPVAQTRPRRPPPPRTAARPADTGAQTSPADASARVAGGQNAPGGANAGNNGAAWMGKLKQWWDQNSFYPREASQADEGGNVRVHIVISGDGRVTSIDVVQSSGSSVLDAAALAVFRNAHLPPPPPGTPPQPADVVVTLHYRPSSSGR